MSQRITTMPDPRNAPSATDRRRAYQRGVITQAPVLAPSSVSIRRCGSGAKQSTMHAARTNTRSHIVITRLATIHTKATTTPAAASHIATCQENKLCAPMTMDLLRLDVQRSHVASLGWTCRTETWPIIWRLCMEHNPAGCLLGSPCADGSGIATTPLGLKALRIEEPRVASRTRQPWARGTIPLGLMDEVANAAMLLSGAYPVVSFGV